MISFKNKSVKRAAVMLAAVSLMFSTGAATASTHVIKPAVSKTVVKAAVVTPLATVPAAPMGLTANNAVPNSIKLTWSILPKGTARNNIDKYTVDYRVNGTDGWINIASLANTINTFNVTPLSQLTNYDFRVGARNSAGTSYSYVNAATKNSGVTAAPSSLLASPFGASGVYLTWLEPSVLNDGVIVDYVVSYKTATDTNYTNFLHPASTTTIITVTGLDPKATYTFRVAAKTSNGTSEAISATLVTQSPIVTMVGAGDNMMSGFNIAGVLGCSGVSCTNFSWGTGSDTTVNSHFNRILNGVNRGTSLNKYNLAAPTAKAADLDAQLAKAPTATGSYVTIQIGLSDVCKVNTVAAMVTPAAFQTSLTTALRNYMTLNPDAKVFMSSIPNVTSIYDAAKSANGVQSLWDTSGACPLYLSSTSTVTTKNAVVSMIPQYNAAISAVCSAYPTNCRYDNLASYNHIYKLSELSTYDYFNLSLEGQKMMSGLMWSKSWWGY